VKPSEFVHSHIRHLDGYVPGLQTEDPEVIKLNTNENPFPIPASVRNALVQEIDGKLLQKYPNPVSQRLREALAAKYGRPPECFLVGNGSDEILSILFRAVLGQDKAMIAPYPTYSLYPVIAALSHSSCIEIQVREDWTLDFEAMLQKIQKGGIALAAFANPNAPTGIAESEKDILDFTSRNPSLTLVDEAYADFGNVTVFKNAGTSTYPRLLVSGTASKALSLAGARIGWLCAEESLIAELEKIKDSYNVSRLAQAAALAAVLDKSEFEKRRDEIVNNRNFLTEGLDRLGFETLPSSTNFIFTRPPADLRALSQRGETAAGAYYRLLLENKILVRYWSSEKLKEWIRITIGTRADMEKLLSTTDSIVSLAKREPISSQ